MQSKEEALTGLIGKISTELGGLWESGYQQGYEKGVKDGADLAAMHGSDATSQNLEKSFWDGAETGANKIWEETRKILFVLPYNDMLSLFCEGYDKPLEYCLFTHFTPDEVLLKLRSYEGTEIPRSEKISVGDEVKFADDDPYDRRGVVISENSHGLDVMWADGVIGGRFHPSELKKTGRSFPQIRYVQERLAKEEGK